MLLLLLIAHAYGAVVPTSGMIISQDTTFTPGTYRLSKGVSVVAAGVTLSMNGASLVGPGTGDGFGVSINASNVTVDGGGGGASGWFYGVYASGVQGLLLRRANFSHNWVDPQSLGPSPPWLDINAPLDLQDKTNLGGGVLLANCKNFTLLDVIADSQENGFSVYDSMDGHITQCSGSHNTGWGVQLHGCERLLVDFCHFDHCNRKGLGDSAGILLNAGSNNNVIDHNFCRYSGDGFFLGNEYSIPNNFNTVTNNDCSHASANAFEATFANNNRFSNNVASLSNYGFWLGYSYNSTVLDNELIGNGRGIQIDHGQNNVISGNKITNSNGPGVVADSDGSKPFPPDKWPWLHLPAQDESTNYIIASNWFADNNDYHVFLQNTTFSRVYNNYFATARGNSKVIFADVLSTASTKFAAATTPVALPDGTRNVVGGSFLAGNWYPDYTGEDSTGDGIGDTMIPYTNSGNIQGSNVGDFMPYKLPNQP